MIDLVCPHILFFSETGQFISTSLVFKAQLADAQRESGLEVKGAPWPHGFQMFWHMALTEI
jgi:hypothetical protein